MDLTIKPLAILSIIFSVLLPFSSHAQSLQELEQRCEDAREKKIAPLRQQAIEECIIQRSSNRTTQDPREQCERFYRNFGDGNATESGGFRQRMFNDLPECVEFLEAEQKQRSGHR